MKGVLKKYRGIFSSLLLSAALLATGAVTRGQQQKEDARDVNVTNPNDSFYYPARYGKNFPKVYTTATQDAPGVDSSVARLWKTLQMLKASNTIIGASLVNFSARANILFTYEPVEWAYSFWRNEDGVVRVSSAFPVSEEFETVLLLHEIIHGVQKSTRLINGDLSLPIRDFQTSVLVYEAAAMVGGNLAAFELYHRGVPGPWEQMRKSMPMKCKQMEENWSLSCKDSTSFASALEKTGLLSLHQQFEDKTWLTSYNMGVVIRYMRALAEKTLPALSGKVYSLSDARVSGYISPEFNFTAGLDSLPVGDLCGGVTMRHAFDYLELERMAYLHGRSDPAFLVFEKELRKRGNPYIGLRVQDIYDGYEAQHGMLNPLQVMDFLLRGENVKSMQIYIAKPKVSP